MISVIIVNYNRKDLLRNCLDSVKAQAFKDTEIIVVDNASLDASSDMVRIYYPEVILIQNKENLLFCKANNQAIEIAKGDFILCLNSDCVLEKSYLKEALGSFSLDNKIGMVSGKLLRMDRITIDSTGLFVGRNRKAIERGYGRRDKGQYDRPGYVFGPSGACAFFKRGMLLDIKDKNGYFDENFGMYYEDLDLCWRAQKKGWKAYYNPNAIAYHARGATAAVHGEINPLGFHRDCRDSTMCCPYKAGFLHITDDLRKRYIINRYRCMKKNDSIMGIILHLPFILLYELKIYAYIFGNFLFPLCAKSRSGQK